MGYCRHMTPHSIPISSLYDLEFRHVLLLAALAGSWFAVHDQGTLLLLQEVTKQEVVAEKWFMRRVCSPAGVNDQEVVHNAVLQALRVRDVYPEARKGVGKKARTVVMLVAEDKPPQLLPNMFGAVQLVLYLA